MLKIAPLLRGLEFLVLFWTFSSRASDRCIVFDIDHTLVSWIENLPKTAPGLQKLENLKEAGDILESDGDQYLVFPGARLLVKEVLKLGKYQIKFFSAGLESRNKTFVRDFLSTFLTSSQIQTYSNQGHFEVYSRHHWKISGKKKNLEIAGCDKSHSVLIDDDPQNIYPGQKKAFLFVPGEPFDLQRFMNDPIYLRMNPSASRSYRRLHYVTEILWEALSQADTSNLPLAEALHTIQIHPELNRYRYFDMFREEKRYQIGSEILSSI